MLLICHHRSHSLVSRPIQYVTLRAHLHAHGYRSPPSTMCTFLYGRLPQQELTQGDLEHPFNLHLKIADFGLSKEGMHSQPKSRVGTVTCGWPPGRR